MKPTLAISHPYCRECIHARTKDPGWCYMFRHGDHVERQGWCGQMDKGLKFFAAPPPSKATLAILAILQNPYGIGPDIRQQLQRSR